MPLSTAYDLIGIVVDKKFGVLSVHLIMAIRDFSYCLYGGPLYGRSVAQVSRASYAVLTAVSFLEAKEILISQVASHTKMH
jgi:hypothetical protein